METIWLTSAKCHYLGTGSVLPLRENVEYSLHTQVHWLLNDFYWLREATEHLRNVDDQNVL